MVVDDQEVAIVDTKILSYVYFLQKGIGFRCLFLFNKEISIKSRD